VNREVTFCARCTAATLTGGVHYIFLLIPAFFYKSTFSLRLLFAAAGLYLSIESNETYHAPLRTIEKQQQQQQRKKKSPSPKGFSLLLSFFAAVELKRTPPALPPTFSLSLARVCCSVLRADKGKETE
jgi:hypothetical protein